MSEIKVKAFFANGKFGFYGNERRRDGDVFYVKENMFSPNWMVKLEEEKPKRKRRTKAEIEAESADLDQSQDLPGEEAI